MIIVIYITSNNLLTFCNFSCNLNRLFICYHRIRQYQTFSCVLFIKSHKRKNDIFMIDSFLQVAIHFPHLIDPFQVLFQFYFLPNSVKSATKKKTSIKRPLNFNKIILLFFHLLYELTP